MPKLHYENFDLLIEPFATGYRARVLASPNGQATADFTLPFSAAEQTAIIAANWSTDPARAFKAVPADTVATKPLDAKTFGARLFAAVFQGDVWTCLTN